MQSIERDLAEFAKQLEEGSIQRAYRALLSYMMSLRTHFKNNLPRSTVSSLFQGYLDITYFAVFPASLKRHDLKIGIAFNYETFQFEAWLAGRNREVQRHYWELIKGSEWPEYRVVTPAKGVFSILECDLAAGFNLDDPETLTATIESATAAFIADIERFLGLR